MFGRGKSKRVRFHCACGQSLSATLRMLSRPFPCPKCGRALHTPRVQKTDTGWAVRFDCPLCGRRTSAPISLHGAKAACEHCRREVAVPDVFEGDAPLVHKHAGEVPIHAQQTIDMPAVGAQPPVEAAPEAPPQQAEPDAPHLEGRTALLKRVMNEEADRVEETHARAVAHHHTAFRISPLVWTATAGALLVLIGSFLPWLAAGDKAASFVAIVTESPWRDGLPAPVVCAALYYAWIALALAAVWLCHDPARRGTFLWILFLAAVTGAAVARTFLPAGQAVAPRAGLYLAAAGLLAVAAAGAVTLWNSIARLGISVLLSLVAAVAVIGSFTDWFGLTAERVTVKAAVAYEDNPETGYSRAAVSIVVCNGGGKPIRLEGDSAAQRAAAPATKDAPRVCRVALEREAAGAWTKSPATPVAALPAGIEPGQEFELKLTLYPVWDLTVPGSETLSPKPETFAGQYRVRFESAGSAVFKPFEIAGVPHPDVDAAALLAKGQAAEKAGRLGEADEQYEAVEKKYSKTPSGPKAAEARRRIGGDARDERETRQITIAIAEIRRLEDEKAVAVKNRPPDRDDGRAVPGVDKMDADIQILTTRIKDARQDLCRLLVQKAERATLADRFGEALRTLDLLAEQKPDAQYAQRGDALRADAVRRAADAATREGVTQVNAALAADQLTLALVTARTLRRGDIRATAGSNDVRLAAESIYQRKCDEVAARLREITCGKRARLFESFLESRTDLSAEIRTEITIEMKTCQEREDKAKELAARADAQRANTTPWYEAVKALLDGYADTDAAAAFLPRKAAVDAWAKERTR